MTKTHPMQFSDESSPIRPSPYWGWLFTLSVYFLAGIFLMIRVLIALVGGVKWTQKSLLNVSIVATRLRDRFM
jgi:hypothetical protein